MELTDTLYNIKEDLEWQVSLHHSTRETRALIEIIDYLHDISDRLSKVEQWQRDENKRQLESI